MKRKIKSSKIVKSGLKFYFLDGLRYIGESKNWIYCIICVFLFFALIAFFVPEAFVKLDPILKNLVDGTEGLNVGQLIIFILDNNLKSSVYVFLLGIFFGIFPLINAIVNGSVLGYVLSKVYTISGFSDFWRILPHGIFELPAIFISLGLGLRLGGAFFGGLGVFKRLRERFVRGGRAFVLVVIPLLVIAAVIEGILIGLSR